MTSHLPHNVKYMNYRIWQGLWTKKNADYLKVETDVKSCLEIWWSKYSYKLLT